MQAEIAVGRGITDVPCDHNDVGMQARLVRNQVPDAAFGAIGRCEYRHELDVSDREAARCGVAFSENAAAVKPRHLIFANNH